ncbi:MAG: hypothetical protein COB59_01995 [Rhodospirillaceae bacterium]|nr:MAG: hypothetical protein COB59_01995 [Rhodospirillaceae bacterium]
MPVDVRKLIFSEEELLASFQDYTHDKKMVNAQSAAESITLSMVKSDRSDQDVLQIVVTFVSPNPKKPIQAELDEHQVIEALITTCKKQAIPLPKKGHKFVKQHKSGIAMCMGLSEADICSAQPV